MDKTLKNLKNQGAECNCWAEPHLFGEIDTPKIPADILPAWLGAYAKAVAQTTQTPEGMAVMLALSTAATCLQKRFVVSPYGDDYIEPLSIWTITSLPPGSRKTAVVSSFTEPLSTWEGEQAERLSGDISLTNSRREINNARIKELTNKAAKSTDNQERESLLVEITAIKNETPDEIISPRLWTGDVTPERLQGMLSEYNERMALLSDEAGIFEVMGELYSNGKANIDVFLQAHAGKSVRVDRSSRTAQLESPAMTFGLTCQPDIISGLSQGNKKTFRGNGALARFLYCIPENNIGKRDVRSHYSIPEALKLEYLRKINELLNIEPLIEQESREVPRRLLLDEYAHECWLAFREYIERNQGENREFEPIQDWTGKLPGAALRIAGIFHVVEHGLSSQIINQATMEKALDLAAILIKHTQAAFDLMGADKSTNDAEAIFSWIVTNNLNKFTRTEVRKALKSRWKQIKCLDNALNILLDRHIIATPDLIKTGGRTATKYTVNPYVTGEDTV